MGIPYPILILPDVERIPVATYHKIEAFVRKGGILVATRRTPSLAPGLADAEAQTREVREISKRLFEGTGRLMAGETQVGQKLTSLFPPDVAMSPAAPDIGFIHRGTGFAEIYFVANTGNKYQRTQATFRVKDLKPEWWDPFTGEVRPARDGATIELYLEPYNSRVLVFSKRTESPARWVGTPAQAPDLSTGWRVTFEGLGRSLFMDKLRSWTEDPATRFFSGQAVYEKTVEISPALVRPQLKLYLDFGAGAEVPEPERRGPGMRAWLESPVREAAVVYVNGKRAGSVWHPPYSVDVAPFVHGGENTIRVVVANTAINELAGRPQPDYKPLYEKYGVRFTPQDMENLQPAPSGILGNIRLMPTGTVRGR